MRASRCFNDLLTFCSRSARSCSEQGMITTHPWAPAISKGTTPRTLPLYRRLLFVEPNPRGSNDILITLLSIKESPAGYTSVFSYLWSDIPLRPGILKGVFIYCRVFWDGQLKVGAGCTLSEPALTGKSLLYLLISFLAGYSLLNPQACT